MPILVLQILEGAIAVALFGQLGASFDVLSKALTEKQLSALRLIFRVVAVVTVLLAAGVGLWLFSRAPNFSWLPALRSPFSVIPSAVALALLLYRLRGEQPFIYGIIEVLFGSGVLAVTAFYPPRDIVTFVVTSAGAVYVIVRGLDNMDRGLPTVLREQWDRAFPKKPSAQKPECAQTPRAKARASAPIKSD